MISTDIASNKLVQYFGFIKGFISDTVGSCSAQTHVRTLLLYLLFRQQFLL